MNLVRLFGWRRDRVHDPARAWDGPPDQTPIHTMLDQRGVPWRLSRGELAQRYSLDAGRILIETPRPLLPGLAGPITTTGEGDAGAAPQEFTALTRFGGEPAEDVRRTAEEVAQYLGRAQVTRSGGGLSCLWRFGAASLSLRSTPDGCEICIRTA